MWLSCRLFVSYGVCVLCECSYALKSHLQTWSRRIVGFHFGTAVRAVPAPPSARGVRTAVCGRAALVAAVPAPGPFRSEVTRRHAGGPRLSRPYPRRARSEVKSRGVMREGRACHGRTRAGPVRTPCAESPSSPLPEISVRNKISSMARTVISDSNQAVSRPSLARAPRGARAEVPRF